MAFISVCKFEFSIFNVRNDIFIFAPKNESYTTIFALYRKRKLVFFSWQLLLYFS